jgi:hypothetical protein
MSTKAGIELTEDLVNLSRQGTPWDVGNGALYDLCEKYPRHEQADHIVAKLWLIGRSYAAAIERRRKKTAFEGDAFYTDYVAPRVVEQQIDEWLSPLERLREAAPENLNQILSTHARLTGLFSQLTALNKRSLASKYLHFHFPDLFFIYDTRATDALALLGIRRSGKPPDVRQSDGTYRTFFDRCLILRERIEEMHQVRLTPRELDNLLLEVSRRKPRKARVSQYKRSASKST